MAPMVVMSFPLFPGALSMDRFPFGAQPYTEVILNLNPVSSKHTISSVLRFFWKDRNSFLSALTLSVCF